MTVLLSTDPALTAALRSPRIAVRLEDARRCDDDLVVIGPQHDLNSALEFSVECRVADPARGVVLVRDEIDSEVLASAMRAGIRQVVRSSDPAGLSAAAQASLELSRQVRAAQEAVHGAEPARVVTIFGSKGGCGKTTVATNLALAMTAAGQRTCLVDLDLAFGDVAIILGLVPEHTLADAVPMAGTLDREATESLVTAHPSGLHALLAPVDPAVAEQISADLVARVLARLREIYEVVVVDSPPAFTEQILAALDVSDDLVLLATPDAPAVKNLRLATRTLDQLDSRARRTIVLNRADAQVGMTVAQVRKLLGADIDVAVPSHRAVSISINSASPLVLKEPNHPVSKAIRSLASGMQESATAPVPLARRLFRRNVATAVSEPASESVSRCTRSARRAKRGPA